MQGRTEVFSLFLERSKVITETDFDTAAGLLVAFWILLMLYAIFRIVKSLTD